MLKRIGCILVMTGCVGGGMVMAVGLKRQNTYIRGIGGVIAAVIRGNGVCR